MNENYYIVRFLAAGYEALIVMHGTEQNVIQTVQRSIKGPLFMNPISRSLAAALQLDFDIKVYECVTSEIEETVITQEVVDPVEDPDFQTNT